MSVEINIKVDTLQKLFDTAVNSMDFTSGCLDDEEVEALREVAVMLGIDPIGATPPKFKCKYLGHCTRSQFRGYNGKYVCEYCYKTLSDDEVK